MGKRFKRGIIKAFTLMTLILVWCLGQSGQAYAEAKWATLAVTDSWVNGSVDNGIMYYDFTIPSAGDVTITFQSYSDSGKCILEDYDLTKAYKSVSTSGSESNPGTQSMTVGMESGHYAIKVCEYWGDDEWTGKYRIKVSFKAAGNNETEPNNAFEQAMKLSQNKVVKGFISEDDNFDFYKISLSSAQTVRFTYNCATSFIFSVWNKDFIAERADEWYNDIEGTGVVEMKLSAGTHYIKFRRNSSTGTYTIKYSTFQYISAVKLKKSTLVVTKGSSYSLLKAVAPSNATYKSLKWSTDNKDVASVTSSGVVKTRNVGSAVISAKTKDGSDITATCLVIVTPGKTTISSAKVKNGRQIEVKVKGQTGISGIQYQLSRSSKFKGKVSTYNASYNEKVANTDLLSASKTYYVRVRTYIDTNGKRYYGAFSSTKKLVTKKTGNVSGWYLWKNA